MGVASLEIENVADSKTSESVVLDVFRVYAAELTARHDRYERLIRISRDATTESKRIIFYLHSLRSEDLPSCLDSVDKRIKVLTEGLLTKAAAELCVGKNFTVPTFRVIAPALEELAEAYCLMQYLKEPSLLTIPSWIDLQRILDIPQDENSVVPYFIVNPTGFMLGVMDFTGELMRMCINRASSDDIESCFLICRLMQQIYTSFLSISYNKDVYKKMSTLKQSLQKVEDTCYKLKIRSLQL